MEDWMVRRNKVGTPSNMFVVLDATTLTVYKSKAAPYRYQVNVRATPFNVDVRRTELHIYLPGAIEGKHRLLRLHISSVDRAYRWKYALESALHSQITDYFTFGESLGSGAYGEVVEAFDVLTSEKRAVKIIQRGTTMKSQEHLESEIQVMKSISHQNIVKTYQIFDLKRTIYIVMEYVSGGDLFDFVAQHSRLTETQAAQTMQSIFLAVEHLHRNGIVHRDLKPENILCVNQSWPLEIKVSDFGFSRFIDPSDDSDNNLRTQVGTVYFMAPEIIQNEGHGPPVDLWACGVIMYTILTGRLPFPGKNTREYFNNVRAGKVLFPSVLWKDISSAAKSLVKGLLNTDPNKRLSSLGALEHCWTASPSQYSNEIHRDRSNLHSRRRRLFKARKAIIAVAMASKFKATIPQVVDKVGDSTRKVASGIEQGFKKTADGVGGGLKKTADGVKRVGEEIGEGTKKVASEIGEGTKKVAGGIAGGTKKVAEGIGTGVKKTVDGVEIGARKVGEGVKKTADGIEKGVKKTAGGVGGGLKKTADGIEKGVKKTADGFEKGMKKTADGIGGGLKRTGEGLKKTGEGIKNVSIQAVEFMKINGGSQTDSTPEARDGTRRRPVFRRRGNNQRTDTSASQDEPVYTDVSSEVTAIEMQSRPRAIDRNLPMESASLQQLSAQSKTCCSDEMGAVSSGAQMSSSDFYSAVEEHSETEEGWKPIGKNTNDVSIEIDDVVSGVTRPTKDSEEDVIMTDRDTPMVSFPKIDLRKMQSTEPEGVSPNFSCTSTVTPVYRPNLTPLSGLPVGLSDESAGPDVSMDCGSPDVSDDLRRTAALLLAANDIMEGKAHQTVPLGGQ